MFYRVLGTVWVMFVEWWAAVSFKERAGRRVAKLFNEPAGGTAADWGWMAGCRCYSNYRK